VPVRFEVCWLLLPALSLIFSSPDCICAVQLAHFIFRLQKSGGPYTCSGAYIHHRRHWTVSVTVVEWDKPEAVAVTVIV